MSLTVIDPKVHLVKDTPAARYFRRALKSEDIMTFFHTETGEWILAYWVNRLGKVVDEIDDLGVAFEKITPEFTTMVRSGWGGIDWAAKKKRFLSKHNNKIRKDQDEILETQEEWDWLRRRTNSIPFLH